MYGINVALVESAVERIVANWKCFLTDRGNRPLIYQEGDFSDKIVAADAQASDDEAIENCRPLAAFEY